MERNIGEIVRKPIAIAAAGLAMGGAIEAMPAAADSGLSAEAVDNCLVEYTHATNGSVPGQFNANVVSFRKLGYSAQLSDERAVHPECDAANVSRSTDIRIRQGGHRIAFANNILNNISDEGASTQGRLRTNRKLLCGRTVTARFVTTATSTETSNTATNAATSRFKVTCS